MARACGHDSLADFEPADLTNWMREVAAITGTGDAGVGHDG
jgi:hypothetical protein